MSKEPTSRDLRLSLRLELYESFTVNGHQGRLRPLTRLPSIVPKLISMTNKPRSASVQSYRLIGSVWLTVRGQVAILEGPFGIQTVTDELAKKPKGFRWTINGDCLSLPLRDGFWIGVSLTTGEQLPPIPVQYSGNGAIIKEPGVVHIRNGMLLVDGRVYKLTSPVLP
jgi:hypothetical protein